MFDTLRVGDLIRESGFKTIALQFPDEFLGHCATIYDRLLDSLADLDVEIFIVGDSTFGSSVDDISALHVDSDLLVYFGSDLSSSGSMPVIVAPFLKNMEDCASCANKLHQAASVENAVDVASKTLILYEPAYHRQIDEVARQLSLLLGSQTIKASMPPSADLTSWTPERSMKKQISSDGSARLIGGLLVPNEVLSEQNLTVYYIGEKHEQLTSITLQVSGSPIVAYSPQSGEVAVHNGSTSRDFRERYGGVSRVKDANIIGIIIGSMGLSEDLTRSIVDRLEALISTARKSSYLFVMGRLNEAKLCNFPEVDVFCLVSNEDVSLIKPKTFHVPVVTPWELELGLGAREWEGVFHSDAASILSGVTIEEAKRRITESLPENPIDSDSEEEVTTSLRDRLRAAAVAPSEDAVVGGAASASSSAVDDHAKNESSSRSLTLPNSERQLVAFSSPALEYYKTREFQGLTPEIPEGLDTDIKQGHYGVAAGYQRYEGPVGRAESTSASSS